MTDAYDDDEEEALAWAGDERPKAAKPAPSIADELEAPADGTASIPAPLLVTYGILAGLYLIYTVGWIITVLRSTMTQSDLLGEIMFQFGEFLAIASPALWFASILFLTRGRKPIIRLLLLLAGLIATAPWPYVLGV